MCRALTQKRDCRGGTIQSGRKRRTSAGSPRRLGRLSIHYSLFTLHFSLFTIHYSLVTFHYSLFTRSRAFTRSLRSPRSEIVEAEGSRRAGGIVFLQDPRDVSVDCLFTIHYSLCTIHYSLFTIHLSLFTLHYSLALALLLALFAHPEARL